MKNKIEILAPAGSYESLKAAVLAGADAVYIGGTRFGARAYANNLPEEELLEAIDYVHLHGRKIYLTINTLLKERELQEELYDYLLPYYKHGLDAVIVQDIGVLTFVKEHFPGLAIHASTQMTITNVSGAKFMEELGVERVVTARELQLEEIAEISKQTDLEIESFVHGALCYCYSGQCLYSSLIGGRSGNRGQCAQPCRLPYKVDGRKDSLYILSPKDICTLEIIPEMVEAGIYSFKIEGRMKKPEYVALVTAMYRKYVDLYFEKGKAGFFVDPIDKEKILDLYNRGGSHTGYYRDYNGRNMISLHRPNHAGIPALKVIKSSGKSVTAKALVDIHAGDVIEMPDQKENFTFSNDNIKGQTVTFHTHQKQQCMPGCVLSRTRNESLLKSVRLDMIDTKIKEKVNGKLTLSATEPSKLVVESGGMKVAVFGEPAQIAVNQPMDEARIEKQLRKTGNTEFEFGSLEIELHGNLFVPMQMLNELRREALESLKREILESFRREVPTKVEKVRSQHTGQHVINGFYVYVETREQLYTARTISSVKRIYADANLWNQIWNNDQVRMDVGDVHQRGKEIYLAFPYIFRQKTKAIYEEQYEKLSCIGFDGILIRNYESFEFLKSHGFNGNLVLDYNMYVFNQYAKDFWLERHVESLTAPVELNYEELSAVGLEESELIVYGYLPMMVSAQCITKTLYGCRREKGVLTFQDRYRKNFSVKNNCDYCYNVIYNTAPVVLLDQSKEIRKLHAKALRLHFTLEDAKQMTDVLELYEEVFMKGKEAPEPDMEFTRGHFKRGVK